MSNHRFVTLFFTALALLLQVLGALSLEASKPHESHALATSSARGEFSPPPGSIYANDPDI
jgi:hypothetical protein